MTQVGWATIDANCEANVGFDKHSFGYRDLDGSAVHDGRTRNAGMAAWDVGDVIGCALWQPDAELPGQILFFKNGAPQGTAFAEVPPAVYFPAVSLFAGAAAAVNLGPVFAHPPQLLFEWISADQLDRPLAEFGSRAKKGRVAEAARVLSAATVAAVAVAAAAATAAAATGEEAPGSLLKRPRAEEERRSSSDSGSLLPRITAVNLLESFPNTSFWVEGKEEMQPN